MPPLSPAPLSRNETIKADSRLLRGTIAEGLRWPETGGIAEDDQQLTKFHGIYQQDDRDLRAERAKKKLEKAFIFMARLRIPGGVLTPAQWIALHDLAAEHGNGTLRLTTRQTIQFHGVIKSNLRPAIQAIHAALLDTIAACGDVNRNVMASVVPQQPAVHAQVLATARAISTHLLPQSRAWHEIWIDDEQVGGWRGRRRADPRPHLSAAQIQDRHRGAAAQRRGCVRARDRPDRHRRVRRRGGLQRRRRRRHGHDAWRAGHVPAYRRCDRLLHARASGGRFARRW